MASSLKLIHSGFQSGIEYSILNYGNQHPDANYHAKHILFDNGKCWATDIENPPEKIGDMITIDMGYVHAVTALEIKNGVGPGACAGRSTKHARIHGSENLDGPWTVLLDKNWDPDPDPYPDPHTPATMEVYTVNETRVRFLKLEIVEATGQYNVPAWEYLGARTGEKNYSLISSEVYSQLTKRRTLSSLAHQSHWPKIQRKQTRAPVNARSSRSSQASKLPSVLQQTAQRRVEEEHQSLKIIFVMTKKGQCIADHYSVDSF